MTNPDKETTEKMSDTIASAFRTAKHAFADHPREVRMNYCSHFMQSASMSFHMAKGAITLAIHAVFPFLLKNAHVVKQLHDEQKEKPKEADKSE
jgi:Family of unknown function (DUF6356)